ncbi:hypothetical protein PHET_06014 [Paragonimus heterotremus]|uniref:Uncharacterized protein n=1 Tax=Paragonimus heterotremus TaxID=100268 RepID=A0A8J4T741_9TREM|nr:hypothetical protein PHET_06014 [Paragonimus heterotremus]
MAVEGRITKYERDELLRVHNEIRESIMNCEYEQFSPVDGYLPRLYPTSHCLSRGENVALYFPFQTWNYTLETMANIHFRRGCGEYFDYKLLIEFIFHGTTFIFESVGQFHE